jgi:hypothetical protein
MVSIRASNSDWYMGTLGLIRKKWFLWQAMEGHVATTSVNVVLHCSVTWSSIVACILLAGEMVSLTHSSDRFSLNLSQ